MTDHHSRHPEAVQRDAGNVIAGTRLRLGIVVVLTFGLGVGLGSGLGDGPDFGAGPAVEAAPGETARGRVRIRLVVPERVDTEDLSYDGSAEETCLTGRGEAPSFRLENDAGVRGRLEWQPDGCYEIRVPNAPGPDGVVRVWMVPEK